FAPLAPPAPGEAPPPPPPAPPPAPPEYAPPSSPSAARLAPGPMTQVRFEPADPDIALMMQTGELPYRRVHRFHRAWYVERGFTPAYSPICDTPCTTEITPGAYHLALSKDGGTARPVGTVVLNAPSTIRATYEDHSAIRTLGALLVVGGIIGGVTMIVVSVVDQSCSSSDGSCSDSVDGPMLAGGIAVIVGGAVLGGILASQHDVANISVTPLTLPTVGALKESPMAALRAEPPPQGAALTVRF
ncbi:MAG: hypothetical protein ACLQBL_32560, partial [Polyangiaceae bacterium]